MQGLEKQQYIVLDLEMTGIDPEWDKITEVCMLKCEGETIIDTYNTFVNPGMKIPKFITALTSITDEDVMDAPPIEDIEDDIREFIGNTPLVGQSIQNDIAFLREANINLDDNEVWDTYDLGSIALPGHPSYSLAALADALHTKNKPSHRAIEDCTANQEVFIGLCRIIQDLGKELLTEISDHAQRGNWDAHTLFTLLEKEAESKKSINDSSARELDLDFGEQKSINEKTPLKPKKINISYDQGKIINLFKDPKGIAEVIPRFEARHGQIEMVNAILESYDVDKNLCIEAGTGTGKTLAYLIPATIKALEEGSKVIISTATHNLQSQLADKDVPTLQKIINHYAKISKKSSSKKTSSKKDTSDEDIPIKVATLKGRRNYLCKKRLDHMKLKPSYSKDEVRMMIKLIIWSGYTKTGDMSEITFARGEEFFWKEVNADSMQSADPMDKHSFINKARKSAQEATVIIVNHALLFSDAGTDNTLLPKDARLIIDEAHHLESVATNQFSRRMRITTAQATLTGFSEEIKKAVTDEFITSKKLEASLHSLIENLDTFSQKIDILFGLVGIFIEAVNTTRQFTSDNVLITPEIKTCKEFVEMYEAAKHANTILSESFSLLARISRGIDDEVPSDKVTSVKETIFTLESALTSFSDTIYTGIIEQEENDIAWVRRGFKQDTTEIDTAPLNVADIISESIFESKDHTILTSATMTTNNSFEYIKGQIGIDNNWTTEQISSTFDYYNNCHVYITKDLPEPNSQKFSEQLNQVIKKAAIETVGRTLVLFTSHSAIETSYKILKNNLKVQGIEVLAQGVTGSRERLLELYKKDPSKHIILGTASFWEGVDLPGDQVKTIIITKLPFETPDDPVFNARSHLYENAFMEYSLPRAILKFKQGFGRLLRTHTDSGQVIICDTRLISKRYGKMFLHSLPSCEIHKLDHAEIEIIPENNKDTKK